MIIGYRSFLPQLARLKAYREKQGLKVALVDVEDLFDEFTFGAHDPQAIKAFLASARAQWRPAPRYVILAGDATSDPRNYLGQPARDFVPTKIVDTEYMETASDDWFADFDADGVPEMAVGRLPIRTPVEAAAVVDKIIGYEQATTPASHEALLVSDTGFEPATDSLAKLLPSSTSSLTVNRRDGPTDAVVRGRILDVLNRGPSVVNYYGHGAVDIWTGAGLLESTDARSLKNAGRLSLFVMMTCLNGYFIEPKTQSLAEALLRAPHGGAFAVWASSGLTTPGDQIRANEELFRQLGATDAPRLGDAMVRAKSVIQDLDVRRTWILFGDPLARCVQPIRITFPLLPRKEPFMGKTGYPKARRDGLVLREASRGAPDLRHGDARGALPECDGGVRVEAVRRRDGRYGDRRPCSRRPRDGDGRGGRLGRAGGSLEAAAPRGRGSARSRRNDVPLAGAQACRRRRGRVGTGGRVDRRAEGGPCGHVHPAGAAVLSRADLLPEHAVPAVGHLSVADADGDDEVPDRSAGRSSPPRWPEAGGRSHRPRRSPLTNSSRSRRSSWARAAERLRGGACATRSSTARRWASSSGMPTACTRCKQRFTSASSPRS